MQKKGFIFSFILFLSSSLSAQIKWINVDSLYGPLPPTMQVFKTTDNLDGKPNVAFYLIADLKDKKISFETDTTHRRRLTPSQFYEKNHRPIVVVNCTFFSFQTNQNLSLVIKNKKVVAYNIHSVPGRGKDTFIYRHPVGSAIGISKKRKADVAWLLTDSTRKHVYSSQHPVHVIKNNEDRLTLDSFIYYTSIADHGGMQRTTSKWKMKTAVGGGPVLVQEGKIKISNNEEMKFGGNAIQDKHPRTAMGYTPDDKLIILVVQGRFPGVSEGATLTQMAKLLVDLGCYEALNLDGGGSSCMLVNGKETIKPSDAGGQRPVPAVFQLTSRHGKSRPK